jgi:hypothetical protein
MRQRSILKAYQKENVIKMLHVSRDNIIPFLEVGEGCDDRQGAGSREHIRQESLLMQEKTPHHFHNQDGGRAGTVAVLSENETDWTRLQCGAIVCLWL